MWVFAGASKENSPSALVLYALAPLPVVGAVVAALVTSGVVWLTPESGGPGVWEALLLGPVGVAVTRHAPARLVSPDRVVTVTVEKGSVNSEIQLLYQECHSGLSPQLPDGYLPPAKLFDLSEEGQNGRQLSVRFKKSVTIAVSLDHYELHQAGTDHSRFTIYHYHQIDDRFVEGNSDDSGGEPERALGWVALPTSINVAT